MLDVIYIYILTSDSRNPRIRPVQPGRLVRRNRRIQILLVDLDLPGNILQLLCGGDRRGARIGSAGIVGLLDGEAAAKGTCQGVVSAADGADVAG